MKISGIILAAGLSKRMGTTKSLLPFAGSTLLQTVVENASKSVLSELIVVLGHEARKIRDEVDLGQCKVIVNSRFASGQSTSMQAGIAAVAEDSAGAMFLLGDQPFVGPQLIDSLVQACAGGLSKIVIPTCRGKRGNPVVILRALFPMLATITGDTGARVLFDNMAKDIRAVEVADTGIHLDLDTVVDYHKLQAMTGECRKLF